MRRLFSFLVVGALALGATGCLQKVEGTGRQQFLITSAEQENQLGAQAYGEVLATEKPSTDPEGNAMIQRVGKRLAAVAPDRGFQYEFTLIESEQMNAFCLPGGKVAFYTGILPLCQNEAGIATVMGHEIAHAIARHGGERMTQGQLAAGAQALLGTYLQTQEYTPEVSQLASAAFGIGLNVAAILPFSRKHELEADELGLQYMAMAGYDPAEGVKFWERFGQVAGGDAGGVQKYLSTHPATGDRAEAFRQQMPKAQALYAKAPEKHGAGAPVPARFRK
ncbi:MAG TPA: M48 family metallopeptidase [Planctomycetota bacterium]|nr:M48 family metallopeptidase [Planctomycetota bacterium]